MRPTNMKKAMTRAVPVVLAVAMVLTAMAHAAAPGIFGGTSGAATFSLTAQPAYITQPDGQSIYSWGYGCVATFTPAFRPTMTGQKCPTMQVPGPTLIVTEGQTVTVTLTNGLPAAAGNTSILFPGFQVTATGGVTGLLTKEAAPGGSVTYSFTATTPGTRAYYSGTQGDLQVEMGLYGAIIVVPAHVPASCVSGATGTSGNLRAANLLVEQAHGETDFRLAASAYDHPSSCYDREYIFQFAAMDPVIHTQAEAQAGKTCPVSAVSASGGCMNVATEPYHPAYFLINGRSMPDDMDTNYASQYPHQPYNGNPHMHPGELVLLRIIGQGRWQHPFHEHANHVRILARDGNLILTPDGQALAGPLLFTTTTTPGLAMDGLFYYTGRGLNWDMYGHTPTSVDANAKLACVPDTNGYFTANSPGFTTAQYAAINYYEWCQDHNKPLQVAPFGDVGAGGPMTLPDSNILTNGAWYGGSPYLGPDATGRATGCMPSGGGQSNAGACATTATTPPSGTILNAPGSEAGFAFMWHSHNEREITTGNIFPGGMFMMMLVDSREFAIDESN